MRSKSYLVFVKEMRVMIRDRRLTVSVVVISLVVMPLLMGFIGNIDRLTGDAGGLEAVVYEGQDATLRRALGRVEGIVYYAAADPTAPTTDYILVRREGETYRIYADGIAEGQRRAAREIQAALEAVRADAVAEALAARGIPRTVGRPYEVAFVDTADAARRSGMMLSVLIPYLAIILLVSNANRAMYVAVGEKEKNTLASLLVSDAPRGAIVVGKTLAITVFAVVSSLLLVVGMLIFANAGFTIGEVSAEVSFQLTGRQTAELLIVLGALSLLIASIIMLLGTYARSAREAGIYTTPLLFIAIFLAVFSFSSTDFATATYAVPILGNALAMRDTFLGDLSGVRLGLAVGGNVLVFVLLALASVRMYDRETILFRA